MKFFKRLAAALYAFSEDPDDDSDIEEERIYTDDQLKQATLDLERKMTGILDDFVLKMPGLRAQAQGMAEIVMQKEKELVDGYFKDILHHYIPETLAQVYLADKKPIPGMTSHIDISPSGKEIKIWFHDKLIGHATLSLKPMPLFFISTYAGSASGTGFFSAAGLVSFIKKAHTNCDVVRIVMIVGSHGVDWSHTKNAAITTETTATAALSLAGSVYLLLSAWKAAATRAPTTESSRKIWMLSMIFLFI